MYNYSAVGNEKLGKVIQERMLRAIENIIDCAGLEIGEKIRLGEDLTPGETSALQTEFGCFFPKGYNAALIEGTVRELWKIIESKDQYIPDLVEEYVLARLINEQESIAKFIDDKIKEPLRSEIKEELIKDFMTEGTSPKEADDYAEDILNSVESYSGIIDMAYHDTDYLLLENFTEKELYENGMDAYYGIGVFEPARKGLPDGREERIGEPRRSEEIFVTLRL